MTSMYHHIPTLFVEMKSHFLLGWTRTSQTPILCFLSSRNYSCKSLDHEQSFQCVIGIIYVHHGYWPVTFLFVVSWCSFGIKIMLALGNVFRKIPSSIFWNNLRTIYISSLSGTTQHWLSIPRLFFNVDFLLLIQSNYLLLICLGFLFLYDSVLVSCTCPCICSFPLGY
jgi:hypothetical protein